MNKKILMAGMFLLVGIFFVNFTLAVCCEKTTSGAWCQDVPASQCDTNYLAEPTACSSTSYCKPGTCIDKRDGDCIENTPQQICDSDKGFWSESTPEDLPQCQLGCCFIGEQAAFVTQTKCKSFASLYSIETHFQTNIQDEISCIASAFPDVKGACVFEREFESTCKMTTRSECQAISDADFHEGFLCTADELATNCAPTDETTCVEGRDEVFFLDSCGNVANVYDSDKIKEIGGQILPADGEETYWKYLTAPDCSDGVGNAGSEICGDCSYFEGSTCKEYNRNKDGIKSDLVGDNICRSLGCEYGGVQYLHGETWCASSEGVTSLDVTGGELSAGEVDNTETNLPGSRYFRMVCYNSEVTVEPCEDKRAEVCIQSERGYVEDGVDKTFKSAVCRVNAWQDCVIQTTQLDCNDTTVRDCQWISGRCVPLIAPGFEFWSDEEAVTDEAAAICSLASTSCTAHYERSLADELTKKDVLVKGYEQIDGEECFDEGGNYISSWGDAQNQYCASLGDCQGKLSGEDKRGAVIEIIKNYLEFK